MSMTSLSCWLLRVHRSLVHRRFEAPALPDPAAPSNQPCPPRVFAVIYSLAVYLMAFVPITVFE
jgi:hypothetical protein